MNKQMKNGFSLVNGLVAITVCSVLTLMAGPLFYRVVSDQRVAEFTDSLVSQLGKGRHVALIEGTSVSLCSSADGQQCTASSWTQGYILFTDNGAAGVVDGTDRILRVVKGKETRLRVTLNGADLVRFQRSGAVVAGATMVAPPVLAQVKPMGFLAALSPISTAHASDQLPYARTEISAGLPSFTVCSGASGRTVQLNAVGRATTTAASCR